MTTGDDVERVLVDVGSAELEVFTGGAAQADLPLICAAHPGEPFGEAAVKLLAAVTGARVMCINLRGLGGSTAPPSTQNYSLESMAEDLDAVRQRLGVAPWVFWGMSSGGWLAELCARRHPEGLAGVIIESCCLCFRERVADPNCIYSPFHSRWRSTLEAAHLIDPGSHNDATVSAMVWMDVPGVGAVFRRRDGAALLVHSTPPSAGMRRVMPALWAMDGRKWWKHVRTPSLVLTSSADPFVPFHFVNALHEQNARTELVIIEGTAHVPTLSRHPDAERAVRGFLDSLRR